MNRRLGTILTAMVTPFDERGDLDPREAGRLARWLVERGNDGLVIAGSTGEGQTLDPAERVALWKAVKEAVGHDAVVIANAGTNSTRESVHAVETAQSAGVDAILAVVPYYNKPTQSGMLAHFGAIAQATPLPIVIYNIPGRTAANMLPETLFELARRHANVVGVKESSGDLKQIGTILRGRSEGFVVWAGDDHLFLPCLSLGADGVVGVASHLCSREYRRMLDAYRVGRVDEAAEIHASLLPLIDALFATTSPIPVKWAMRQLGFRTGECRLPLDAMPDGIAARLHPLLAPYASHPPSTPLRTSSESR
jgi:4-hydroxy-tetrahydrodipicolinate synthase